MQTIRVSRRPGWCRNGSIESNPAPARIAYTTAGRGAIIRTDGVGRHPTVNRSLLSWIPHRVRTWQRGVFPPDPASAPRAATAGPAVGARGACDDVSVPGGDDSLPPVVSLGDKESGSGSARSAKFPKGQRRSVRGKPVLTTAVRSVHKMAAGEFQSRL